MSVCTVLRGSCGRDTWQVQERVSHLDALHPRSEVGERKEVLADGCKHPESILLIDVEQEAGGDEIHALAVPNSAVAQGVRPQNPVKKSIDCWMNSRG